MSQAHLVEAARDVGTFHVLALLFLTRAGRRESEADSDSSDAGERCARRV